MYKERILSTMIKNIHFLYNTTANYSSLVGKVFANGPGEQGSIPGRVTPKTLKKVLDTSLLNTQHYKVHIKGSEAIQGKE